MKYSLHITKRAEKDIESAADYIEFNLFNPKAAEELLNNVEKEMETLMDLAELHPVVDEDPLLKAWGIRFAPIDNYLAFYVIDQGSRAVYIIRFLYKKRNWIKILKIAPPDRS